MGLNRMPCRSTPYGTEAAASIVDAVQMTDVLVAQILAEP
jgi:hypothetical protein